ncbi:hypothetical protein STEG23_018768, partial [Scotinomys teguina]
ESLFCSKVVLTEEALREITVVQKNAMMESSRNSHPWGLYLPMKEGPAANEPKKPPGSDDNGEINYLGPSYQGIMAAAA